MGVKGSWVDYVPAIGALRTYSWDSCRRDGIAGLTVAAVAVPQAMAYASIFGVPEQYGLYTAIVMTAVGALFDSSRRLINGPTNAISIAMLSSLASIDGPQRIEAAIMMAAMIGSIQVGITLLRLGDLSRYISHAVIVGFTLGASVLLVLDQMKNVLGLKSQGTPLDHFVVRFFRTMTQGGGPHWPTALVSVMTVLLVILLRRVNRRFGFGIPELLTALIVVAFCVAQFDPERTAAIALVPQIPRSLPSFQLPKLDWPLMQELFDSALAIALLGLLEAIAMAKSLAVQTRDKLDVNQQCLSEGVANLTGSFFQCFPGSGSLTRSYINYQAGAVTQWSGVVSAAAVALTILALAPLAQYIPRAALAGILILSAARMVDYKQLQYHLRATRFDALIVLATALSAVFISIEFCILIGVVLSFMFYVPRAARTQMSELTVTPQNVVRPMRPEDATCARMRIYNLEGEWFFGSAPDVEMTLERIEETASEGIRIVVLRMKHVRNLDGVCMHLFDDFLHRMADRDIKVLVCGVRDEVFQVFENVGLVERLGPNRIFQETDQLWSSTLTTIQTAYQELGSELCDHCPRKLNGLQETRDWHYEI